MEPMRREIDRELDLTLEHHAVRHRLVLEAQWFGQVHAGLKRVVASDFRARSIQLYALRGCGWMSKSIHSQDGSSVVRLFNGPEQRQPTVRLKIRKFGENRRVAPTVSITFRGVR